MADTPPPPPGGTTPPLGGGATPPGGSPAGGQQDQQAAPRLAVLVQYVKDLSFENPRSPGSLQQGAARPEIQVRVDVRAQPMESERYEVVLKLEVEAKTGGEVSFVLELSYAGLFHVQNVPQESLHPLLLIECPRLLFPFARRIVADATRDGGLPPLMIDPIDFLALYRRRLQQQQQQAASGQPAGTPPQGTPPQGTTQA
jgi:preprotein translocase subunit SecB